MSENETPDKKMAAHEKTEAERTSVSGQNNSVYDQVCFSGDSSCSQFKGHFLKPDICTSCMKELAKHARESIPDEESILKV